MSADILHFSRMDGAPNRIRELRTAAGLSQQALGDAIGVSKVTISDLERGAMQLTLDYMRRIGHVLGVPAADLLPITDNPWLLSPDEQSLVSRYRAGNDHERDQVQKVADVLLPFKHQGQQAA